MEAHAHALSGAVAFTAAAPLLHVTGWPVLAGAVFTAGAATAPDIDEPGSTVSRTLGFFTMTVAWLARKVSGGHRKGTHSIAGVAVFTGAAWAGVMFATGLAGRIILTVIIGLLLAAAGRALFRLRMHTADLAGLAAATIVVWGAPGVLVWVPGCVALGAAAHIAGDELTHDGCPLLWPLDGRDFHLLPERLRLSTGKFAEHWVVSVLLLAALVVLLVRDTGLAAALTHHQMSGGTRH